MFDLIYCFQVFELNLMTRDSIVRKIGFMILLVSVMGFSAMIFADDTAVLGATPVQQEYHAALPSTPVVTQPTQTVSSPVTLAAQPAAAVSTSGNSAGVDTSLQAQLSQLNQETLLYQQQSDQRIEALSSKNEILMSQLNSLNQAISELQQELNTVRQTEMQYVGSNVTHSSSSHWQNWFSGLTKLNMANDITFVLIAILLFSLSIGIMQFKRRYSTLQTHEKDDTEDEYNFMSTHEAIPATLDLARAYVAMEDFTQAKIALKKVIDNGNEEQRSEAKKLLLKVK